ncbi:FN1 [Branchiostoma lanceolatum]|uniref:FN1 protein n=1 Tax=Branchiostoma lanceolatum TaxID=7740 RepID=A0A8J9ZPS3_BRALA|nr:FN1 [Branchiostoma lanceolatum]
MKIQLLILAILAGTACAKPLKAVEEPEKTYGDAQATGGHGRASGLGRLTENPDVGVGPGFDDRMAGYVTSPDVEESFNTDNVPYGPLRGPEEPANRNVRAVSGSEGIPGWLNGPESWVVDFFPTTYQDPPWNALDCSPDTTWRPPSSRIRPNRKYWIIMDMQERYRVYQIRVVQVGNSVHDIKDFVLEMSSVHPYVWEVVERSDAVLVGTTEQQHFGDFDVTSQYWRITMRSISGRPVQIKDFCFFGHKVTPPPEDFQMTYVTETSVTVSWKQRTNSLAIHHKILIRRSDTADSLFTQLVPIDQTDLTFTDLTPGTEYVISATSFNRQNEGPAVNLIVGTKTDSPMALDVEQMTTNTITISWLPPKAALTAYNITYTEDGRSTSMMTSGDVDSCELTDLVPGTQYDIDLVAVSRVGKSIAIGISVITDTDPPSSLRVTKSFTTWMFLEWTPSMANILFYDLDISDEYGGEGTLMRLDGHETSYNITGLVPEATYVIKMAAYSEHGRSVQKLAQGLEQSLPEVVGPEDILAVSSNINEIIKRRGDGFESEIPPSVLQTTAGIIEKLASAAKGSQDISIENMGTIADALLQAASAVIDVLPKTETQTDSNSDNVLESDLIDTSSTDLSPKQQLKMLQEKEREKEDMVAETLLALQPEDVKYHSSFKTENLAVNVARFSSDEELILDSGDIVATIPPTPGSKTHDMRDVKTLLFKKNPYSWSESTGGQNISSSVSFLTIESKNSGSERKGQEVKLDIPFVPSRERGQPTGRPSQVTTERPSTADDNTNGTTMAYHAFNVQYDNVIPVVRMNWWDVEATFHVYISYGSPPTEEKYDEKRVIKEDGYEAWLRGTDLSTSFIPNTTNHGGRILYVGVQKLGSVSFAKHQQQPTVQILSNDDYTLSISAVGCSSWKDSDNQWKLEGCDADIDLDHGTISCRCHMSERKVFVGTMTLPLPNSINFINAFKNFRNLSENSVVFSIVVSEYILYILLMVFLCVDFHRIWMTLRHPASRISPISGESGGENNQRKPLDKVSLLPPDRMPAPHVYQITVTTGSMFGAGTTSRIGFQLFGSEGTSPIKMLNPEGEVGAVAQ